MLGCTCAPFWVLVSCRASPALKTIRYIWNGSLFSSCVSAESNATCKCRVLTEWEWGRVREIERGGRGVRVVECTTVTACVAPQVMLQMLLHLRRCSLSLMMHLYLGHSRVRAIWDCKLVIETSLPCVWWYWKTVFHSCLGWWFELSLITLKT